MIEVCPPRSSRVWRGAKGPITSRHHDLRRGYPIKVMLWGCMSSRGFGSVAVIHGSMNTEKYLEVMESHLLPQAAIWYPSGDWTFQQDGARCHTSNRARQYFDNMNIPLLPWTANSPDLNPIENIWSLLKKKVYRRGALNLQNPIQNVNLVLEDRDYWNSVCARLIASMPRRVASVIEKKGGPTKY